MGGDAETEELADINREIAVLEARERLLALRSRVAQAESAYSVLSSSVPAAAAKRKIKANDVEPLVSTFSGDDDYDIRKWLDDFDNVMKSLGADDNDRYRMGRHLLRGTASVFLRTIQAPDWIELHRLLLQRFGRRVSNQEIYERLRARHRQPSESIIHYITCMQEIAQRVSFSEVDLIPLIVAGLRDSSVYTAFLISANSVEQLIGMIPAFERTTALTRTGQSSAANVGPNSRRPPSAQRPINTSGQIFTSVPSAQPNANVAAPAKRIDDRCFNCSAFGHKSAECPAARRAPGSCFRCGSMDHQYNNCPKRVRRTVAAIESSDQMTNAGERDEDDDDIVAGIGNMPMVSVSFEYSTDRWTLANSVHSLIDTGSPTSFIRCSVLPSSIQLSPLRHSKFIGVGNVPITTYGYLNCAVRLCNRQQIIPIVIVPDGLLPMPMLIGRDALQLFNIDLFFCSKYNHTIIKENNVFHNVNTLQARNKNIESKENSDETVFLIGKSSTETCNSVVDDSSVTLANILNTPECKNDLIDDNF